ncbi:MAG: addiction module protein [Syntrophobacteraceae bacterium]|jgi:putative addiction module component (TIGR02574 family)
MERCLTPSEIKKLSVAERILIVEEIWDSIAAEQESVQLTEAQKTELDRRITSCDSSPNEGRSWEEIKRRLSFSWSS